MQTQSKPSFLTLLLMISFASVNAVLFTPALPEIATFFKISDSTAQLTITWFLIGYAAGQLIYGPLANRFGRKKALYAGISLQIISSILCIIAGILHNYLLLVIGRLLLALGSGVGLKMTFTLVNETYEAKVASQKLSYLMIAFAITPGLSVMLGGYLSVYFGWMSTFAACGVYGIILLILTARLPETKKTLDMNALQINYLLNSYLSQFKSFHLVAGGLLMGGATCFVYVFAALAPFIAIDLMHMDVSTYGTANLLPSIGLVLGSLTSAQLAKKFKLISLVKLGVVLTLLASITMLLLMMMTTSALLTVFFPMTLCYFGLSLVFANASTLAMSDSTDKAHASSVMNFINMGSVTLLVLSISAFTLNSYILPAIYIAISLFMAALAKFAFKR